MKLIQRIGHTRGRQLDSSWRLNLVVFKILEEIVVLIERISEWQSRNLYQLISVDLLNAVLSGHK